MAQVQLKKIYGSESYIAFLIRIKNLLEKQGYIATIDDAENLILDQEPSQWFDLADMPDDSLMVCLKKSIIEL